MSTLTPSSPLKIVGKEFLIDENLLVSNYNPYDTRNPSGFSGLSQLRNVQGKLYVLDTTNFKEPTPAEFRDIKTLGDFTTGFRLVPGAVLNYFSVNMDFSYETDPITKRTITIIPGSGTGSIIPTISSEQAPDIFLDSFCILVLDENAGDTFHKAYADIPDAEQKFMWLIPTSEVLVTVGGGSSGTDDTKLLNFSIVNPGNQTATTYSFYEHGILNQDGINPDKILPVQTNPHKYNFVDTFQDLPDSLTWERIGDSPAATVGERQTINGYIYSFGGSISSTATVSNILYRIKLDTTGATTGNWENIGTLPIIPARGGIIRIKDKLWIFGGYNTSNVYSNPVYWCDAPTEENGNQLGTWTLWGNLPLAGAGYQLVIHKNKVYLFGRWHTTGGSEIQIGNIDTDGMISNFYVSDVSFPYLANPTGSFVYNDLSGELGVYVLSGYNYTTATYVRDLIYFGIDEDGNLTQPIINNQILTDPITGAGGYHAAAQYIIGNKLYQFGGVIGEGSYTNKVIVQDIQPRTNLTDPFSIFSEARPAGNFPISFPYGYGTITKNYIYLFIGAEGSNSATYAASKKVYRADISSFGTARNDYYTDTNIDHYNGKVLVPGDNTSSVGYKFNNAKLKFQVPYYTNIIDPLNPVQILDTEILAVAKKLKLNSKYLDHLTLDDLVIPVLSPEQLAINGLDTILDITINEETLNRYIPEHAVNPDPNWKDTILLLNGETNYDQTAKNYIEYNGNFPTTGISEETKKFGTSSMYFDGTSWLRVLPNQDLNFGAKNFTVEFWFNGTLPLTGSINPCGRWGAQPTTRSWMIAINPNGELQFGVSTDGTTGLYATTEPGLIQNDTWAHIALTRNADSIDLWVNGIKTTATYSIGIESIYSSVTELTIGAISSEVGLVTDGNAGRITGYIDGLRITNIARYQNDFTPPEDIMIQLISPKLKDTSTKLEIFGNTKAVAAYTFEGNTNDLSGSYNAASSITYTNDSKFGTSAAQFNSAGTSYVNSYNLNTTQDFTVSLWLKLSNYETAPQCVFTRAGTTSNVADLNGLILNADGTFRWTNEHANNAEIQLLSSTSSLGSVKLALNKWENITITQTGITCYMYYNGTLLASLKDSRWLIGAATRTSSPFKLGVKYIPATSATNYKHKVDQLRIFQAGIQQEQVNVLVSEKIFTYPDLSQDKISELNVVAPKTIALADKTIPIKITELSGGWNLPETFFKYDLDTVPGGTSFFEVQQLASAQTEGISFSTGKKVYLYGGRGDINTSVSYASSNTLWVSNILNDGQLEGFTQVGTNTLNFNGGATYTHGSFVYIFGGVTGSTGTTQNTLNTIRRTQIQEDGSIGAWEIIGTLPVSTNNALVVAHPEDPKRLYISIFYTAVSGVSSEPAIKMVTIDISEDGGIPPENIKSLEIDQWFHQNKMVILKDHNGYYNLFIFGTMYSENNPGIYFIKIRDKNLIGQPQKIGTMHKSFSYAHIITDTDNVYLIGGLGNTTGSIYGASGFVQKYSKTDLLAAVDQETLESNNNIPVTCTLLPNLTIPISSGTQIETAYANYIICPRTTTNTTGTVYNWQSTGRILGIKKNYTTLGENGLNFDTSKIELVSNNNQGQKILPNKLNFRIKEESLQDLVVRKTQALEAFNTVIKFKDPSGNIITLEEVNKAIGISSLETTFLRYLTKLSEETFLDKYNEYVFINDVSNNAAGANGVYDLIIPEIILNIICDLNMLEINKSVFTWYYTNYPPEDYGIDLLLDTPTLDKIFNTFGRVKSSSLTSTPATYTASGIQLPKHDKFGYSKYQHDIANIFIPQRNTSYGSGYTLGMDERFLAYKLNTPYALKYLNEPNCKINTNPEFVDNSLLMQNLEDYYANFSYFVGPNGVGLSTNDGLTPLTPKNNLSGIPAGATVCLMPGIYIEYTQYTSEDNITSTQLNVFIGNNNHNIYGCGDLTILDRSIKVGGRDKPVVGYFNSTGGFKIHNLTVKHLTHVSDLAWANALTRYVNSVFSNVNFIITGKYSLVVGPGNTANYNLCTFTGGTRQSNYNGTSTITSNSSTTVYDAQPISEAYALAPDEFKATFKSKYKFTPKYTLIPVSDDSNPDTNSIVLETTTNVSNIPNLDYKLS